MLLDWAEPDAVLPDTVRVELSLLLFLTEESELFEFRVLLLFATLVDESELFELRVELSELSLFEFELSVAVLPLLAAWPALPELLPSSPRPVLLSWPLLLVEPLLADVPAELPSSPRPVLLSWPLLLVEPLLADVPADELRSLPF